MEYVTELSTQTTKAPETNKHIKIAIATLSAE